MQEEMENRTVQLAVSTTKLTARTIISAVRAYLNHRKNVGMEKEQKNEPPSGKQSVKELHAGNDSIQNMDMAKTDLKGFEGIARKYDIDYAIEKVSSKGKSPRYLVFFKSKDAETLKTAFDEYAKKVLEKQKRKEDRPSVLEQLKKLKDLIKSLPDKTLHREKTKERSR